MNDAAAAVERLAFRAWPAEHEYRADGWAYRHSPGIRARRINSVTTPPGRVVDAPAATARILDWCGERGLHPIVRVLSVADAAFDAYLADHGWTSEGATSTLAKRLEPGGDAEPSIVIESEPSPAWSAAKQRLVGFSAEAIDAWLRRARAITGELGFASCRVDGTIATIGMGVVEDGWLGLFDLNTDPSQRRTGLARAVVRALEVWGAAAGARDAYLQVESANTAALELYRHEGYSRLYEYWYRRAP